MLSIGMSVNCIFLTNQQYRSLDEARNGFSISGDEMFERLRFTGWFKLYSTNEFVDKISWK